MSALRAILEDFDRGGVSHENEVRAQQLKAAAYAEGFAAAEAAAAARQASEQAILTAFAERVDEILANLPVTLGEQFCEALKTVLEKALPALSEKGFAGEVAASVMKYADFSNTGRIVVKAPESRVAEIKAAFSELNGGKGIIVEADPDLAGAAVTAAWENGGLDIDVDAFVALAIKSLGNYVTGSAESE